MSRDVLSISRLFSSRIYKEARFFSFRDGVVDQRRVEISVEKGVVVTGIKRLFWWLIIISL